MSAALVSTQTREERTDLPLWWAISLHLLPGVLILLFYVFTAPLFADANIPMLTSIVLAIAVVLLPFELGLLLYLGKRRNGRLSLDGIVLYREKTPLVHYLWLVPVLELWSIAVFLKIGEPLDQAVTQRLLFWLPDLVQRSTFGITAAHLAHPRAILLAFWAAYLLLNGLIAPVVEEYYFRGYLLPRLKALGAWAPLVNVLLFSLYHLFSPWQNASRILALVPLVYAVWWKRDIRISILVHCILNIGSVSMLLPVVLRAG